MATPHCSTWDLGRARKLLQGWWRGGAFSRVEMWQRAGKRRDEMPTQGPSKALGTAALTRCPPRRHICWHHAQYVSLATPRDLREVQHPRGKADLVAQISPGRWHLPSVPQPAVQEAGRAGTGSTEPTAQPGSHTLHAAPPPGHTDTLCPWEPLDRFSQAAAPRRSTELIRLHRSNKATGPAAHKRGSRLPCPAPSGAGK